MTAVRRTRSTRHQFARRIGLGLGAATMVVAGLATTTATAGAAAPSGFTAGAQTGPTAVMRLSCTLTALKFNYGAALAGRPGATVIDIINGENLQKIALDEWNRNGCDTNGLMPVW